MVYRNRFVGVVKVGGKILRERDGQVQVPFGSEYSILLKNLNSAKSMAKIDIDGKDATGWLVLDPNSNIEVERFIRDHNLDSGNRFKFIERTQEIEDHRGIQSDDGLIRIEYKFAKKQVEWPVYQYTYYNIPTYPIFYRQFTNSVSRPVRSLGINTEAFTVNAITGSTCNTSYQWALNTSSESERGQNFQCSVTMDSLDNDQGITVAGSESNQKFYNVPSFETEASDVIVIRLKGQKAGSKPVTVSEKPKCVTCGRTNQGVAKFCNNCGTSLDII